MTSSIPARRKTHRLIGLWFYRQILYSIFFYIENWLKELTQFCIFSEKKMLKTNWFVSLAKLFSGNWLCNLKCTNFESNSLLSTCLWIYPLLLNETKALSNTLNAVGAYQKVYVHDNLLLQGIYIFHCISILFYLSYRFYSLFLL